MEFHSSTSGQDVRTCRIMPYCGTTDLAPLGGGPFRPRTAAVLFIFWLLLAAAPLATDLAFKPLLRRMDESRLWIRDLGTRHSQHDCWTLAEPPWAILKNADEPRERREENRQPAGIAFQSSEKDTPHERFSPSNLCRLSPVAALRRVCQVRRARTAYQATGIKICEVTTTSAIVWTRSDAQRRARGNGRTAARRPVQGPQDRPVRRQSTASRPDMEPVVSSQRRRPWTPSRRGAGRAGRRAGALPAAGAGSMARRPTGKPSTPAAISRAHFPLNGLAQNRPPAVQVRWSIRRRSGQTRERAIPHRALARSSPPAWFSP